MNTASYSASVTSSACEVDIANSTTLRFGAWQVCAELVTGWTEVQQQDIDVVEISGGITNKLYKVTASRSPSLQPVLLRVYGQGTDFFIDRARELAIIAAASNAGLGAKVYGTFANGRLEEWLLVRNLEPAEMLLPSVSRAVAATLCRFHRLQVPGLAAQSELFATIHKWFTKALSLTFDDDAHKHQLHTQLDVAARLLDFEDVAAVCTQFQSPVVFGHNDLLSGNVLVPAEYKSGAATPSPPVNFIDFEYSAYTFRGFDVGNHFNECAGFDCNWDNYPNDQQARVFAAAYLEQSSGAAPNEDQVTAFVTEAHLFALISHAYWGIWAVLQAKWSTLDFDYLSYAHLRWNRFRDTRAAAVAAAQKLMVR